MTELIFVYNADSGLFNSVADAAHKLLSPETYACNLCKVTYGLFTERKQWRSFVESLDAKCRFLHRDELYRQYPGLRATALPAVLRVTNGQPSICLDAQTLNACADLDSLMRLIRAGCQDAHQAPPRDDP
jgi:hypothetical protein